MKIHLGTSLGLLTCLALVLSPTRADEVKSGPYGRIGGHFEVKAVTGELQGKTVCYVCKFAGEQFPATVLIFSQKTDDNVATLVKAVDGVQKKNAKLGTFLVGVGGVTEADLRKLQDAHQLLTPLTIAVEKDGPKHYHLNKEAVVTVLVYELGGPIRRSYGFTDTQSAAAKAGDIAAAAQKVLDKSK